MFRFISVLFLLLATQLIAQAADSSSIHLREESNTNGSSTRSLFGIIWGCASTAIICAWAALHPNIPPREGPVKETLRRVELMLWTIVAPEIIPTWALNQFLGAMTVKNVYNKAGAVRQKNEDGMWTSVKRWFSFEERKVSACQTWTVRHGQFLIMGGIHLVEPAEATTRATLPEPRSDDIELAEITPSLAKTSGIKDAPDRLVAETERGRVTILTLEILEELVKDPLFEIRLTEDEISDRSKGDGLSKLIFMLQSSWFITQCIARRSQGLALTQLELTTLAMASLNAVTCILWWHKPLNAQAIVYVYLTRNLTDKERNVEKRGQSARSRFVQKVFKNNRCPSFCQSTIFRVALVIVALPLFLICGIIIVGFDVVGVGSIYFLVDATHVSTFYRPRHGYNGFWHIPLLLSLASLFGGIHCAGWNFSFPSYAQRTLWHGASLAVTILPVIAIPIGIVVALMLAKCNHDDPDIFKYALTSANIILLPLYAAARLILLGQAIALLRHLPPTALTAIDWSQFYPHFF